MMRDKENKSESIVYRISKDNGRTFGNTTTLYSFNEPFGIRGPDVAFPSPEQGGNNVFLTWVDKSSPSKLDVYFSRNSDDGSNFEQPIILSDAETGVCSGSNSTDLKSFFDGMEKTYDVMHSFITSSSDNNVYVMWVDMTATGGKSKNDRNMPTSRGFDVNTAEGRKEYEEYEKNLPKYEISFRIFFRASADGGRTFGRIINILNTKASNQSSPNASIFARLTASENNVYITIDPVGTEPNNSSIRFFRSVNNGLTFEEKQILQNVDLPKGFRLVDARLAVAYMQPNSLYLMVTSTDYNFEEMRKSFLPPNPDFRHFLVRSVDSGNSLSKPAKLVDKMPGSFHSSFSVSSNGKNVYFAYADPGHSFDIMADTIRGLRDSFFGQPHIGETFQAQDTVGSIVVRSSSDGGISFKDSVRLKDSKDMLGGGFGTFIMLLPFGDNGLYVLRPRNIDRSNRSGNESRHGFPDSEVLLWRSSDAGKSFEDPIAVSEGIRDSSYPHGIVVSDNLEDGKNISSGSGSVAHRLYLVWTAEDLASGGRDVYFRSIGP